MRDNIFSRESIKESDELDGSMSRVCQQRE